MPPPGQARQPNAENEQRGRLRHAIDDDVVGDEDVVELSTEGAPEVDM
jgi:hypothetical protein